MDPIWSQKSSVNRDFTVLSGVIVFIALLTSLWVAYETFSDEADRISSQLSEEAKRIDKGFDAEIDRAGYVLESIGRQIIQRGMNDTTEIAQMLRAFDGNNEYYSVFLWVNSDLQAVTSSRQGILAAPIDLADRPYIQQSKQQPFRIKIGNPTTGRISERLVIPMAMGLTDHTGRYIGSVTLSIDLQNLTNRIKEYIHTPRVSFTILNDDGSSMTNDSELAEGTAADEALLDRVRSDIAHKNDSGFMKSPTLFSSNRIFAYYHKSAYHDYHIVSAFVSDYNAVRTLILPRMLQLILVASFLVSLLWLVRFRIIFPVQTLADASSRIARGETEILVPKTGPLEITRLGQSLEKTVQYINEHKKIEEELITKVLGLKTAKETAEISDQAKMQILQLLRPEIMPALEDVIEIANLLSETSEERSADDNALLNEQLEHASIHLQEVVQEIFDMPSLSEWHYLATRKPVDIGTLVHKCVMLLGDSLDREEVNVNIRLQEDLPKLSINELHLMHIVMHLVIACANAIPAGGELTIEAALEETNEGTEFALMFNDNASGMDVQRIASFWRANPLALQENNAQNSKNSDFSDEENMSAVLLTKKIIMLHKGRLTVQNPPDKEAVITVYFQQ